MWNVGVYTHGMMGHTPNIDRIGREGMVFTDHYGQPSCTAGRAAFLTGQLPIRTGMTTIGIPDSPKRNPRSQTIPARRIPSTSRSSARAACGSHGDDGSGIARVGYIGRKFFCSKLWAPTAAGPFLAAHLKSIADYPPSQGADSLSMKKVIEKAMAKMDAPHGSSN
jgi:Sulfatase